MPNYAQRPERANEEICPACNSFVLCFTQHNCCTDFRQASLAKWNVCRSEAHRARSTAEFVSKINGGLQELEETAYWLELLGESEVMPSDRLKAIGQETAELTAIFVTLIKNAKNKKKVA